MLPGAKIACPYFSFLKRNSAEEAPTGNKNSNLLPYILELGWLCCTSPNQMSWAHLFLYFRFVINNIIENKVVLLFVYL
jgi:hypothetical protein